MSLYKGWMDTLKSFVANLYIRTIIRFRWVVVIWCVLPISLLQNALLNFRNWFIFTINSAPLTHNRKVSIVQRQVRQWNDSDRKTKMSTARPEWMSINSRFSKYKKGCTLVSVDDLKDILEINEEKEYVHVESMVTMGQLTKYLLPRNYTLPVVPGLEDLTVGGLINGCGIESSSMKYGLFQELCITFEMVLADGSLITTGKSKGSTRPENIPYFYAVPWSLGTIGFVVSAKLKIIPCKPCVRLTYIPCNSRQMMIDTLVEETNSHQNEFVEAIQFSQDFGVVTKGVFSDNPASQRLNCIGRWYKPSFHKHVERIGQMRCKFTEFIPLRDYYHRHSRNIFWQLQDLIPFADNVLFRYLFGWSLPPKISWLKRLTSKTVQEIYEHQYVFQNLFVPMKYLNETLDFVDSEFEIYPIWLCPFVLSSSPGFLRLLSGRKAFFCDVGVFGRYNKSFSLLSVLRKMGNFLSSISGFQMLNSDCRLEKPEFWGMFDSALYDWLRGKYGAQEAFPNLYEKACISCT